MANWLREQGVVLSATLIFRAPLTMADCELVDSDKPWNEFEQRLGQVHNTTVVNGVGEDVGQSELASEEREGLIRTVAEQSRFFKYEHLNCLKCWSSEWSVVAGSRYGCPKAVV